MNEDKPTEDERRDKRPRPPWTAPEVKELGIVDGTAVKGSPYVEGGISKTS